MENNQVVEEAFNDAFASASGNGEEELLRIASKFAFQLTGRQMRTLLLLHFICLQQPEEPNSQALMTMMDKWIELKQNHESSPYIMRALDSISLRRFVNENSVKVNVQKQ